MSVTESMPADQAQSTDPEQIARLAVAVGQAVQEGTEAIRGITSRTKMLALNALIEAARAGDAGRGFSIVANEVKGISGEIEEVAQNLESELVGKARLLEQVGARLTEAVRGQRLADLALNAIEIIDRNLYERTCDVRWWATDSAVVAAAAERSDAACRHASQRLGVILDAYTVYLDLWIADAAGTVIANGRPDRYRVAGHSVAGEAWFRDALGSASGDDYAVADITACRALDNSLVATYAAAIREGGERHGRVLGVLGIHFDWQPQAMAVVNGVRLSAEERRRSRVLLLDSQHKVIAASDNVGVLASHFALATQRGDIGHYETSDGAVVGYARTPGYETYRGLGWYGCVVQRRAEDA
ncbi:methyl-accepting chemotaxis protein [Parapedomonas caeni]